MVHISDSEWKIMNLLWDEEPRTMTQITKALYKETGWSKHTVITLLKRLEAKGILHYEDGGKSKLFYYDVSRSDAVMEEKKNFLNKVFKGQAGLMVANMIEQGDFSSEDIDMLRDLLSKKS
ncbi:MAG: BlaI/MecI/CopY family transcriptional regulator [Lachnospiraceae bacterium]|jgi:BlaI family penicillinase repressor|nr:BlaI/MecI/CopY family transcriptional regulator [Lachnospiraceae bacterium]